ncbi:unnamed protein product [Musa acuminata var. zebrina]
MTRLPQGRTRQAEKRGSQSRKGPRIHLEVCWNRVLQGEPAFISDQAVGAVSFLRSCSKHGRSLRRGKAGSSSRE